MLTEAGSTNANVKTYCQSRSFENAVFTQMLTWWTMKGSCYDIIRLAKHVIMLTEADSTGGNVKTNCQNKPS